MGLGSNTQLLVPELFPQLLVSLLLSLLLEMHSGPFEPVDVASSPLGSILPPSGTKLGTAPSTAPSPNTVLQLEPLGTAEGID